MRWSIHACVVFFVLFVAASTGRAQATEPEAEPVSPGQAFYDQARELYGDRQYAQALDLLIRAIQADPTDPRYWIGAARAANFSDQLDLSLRLYDAYTASFPEHAEAARRRGDRLAAVQRERDEVDERRPTPGAPPALPPDQQAARATFGERLQTGPAVAVDGSGALTLYRTLLRTGYVAVDLQQLRQQLADSIMAQIDELFEPTPASPVPVMELRGWEALPDWVEAVQSLGRPVTDKPPVQAKLAAAEGQRQLLNGNYRVALEQFEQAVTLDPTLVMAHIGLLMARHRGVQYEGCCAEPAGAGVHLEAIAAGIPADFANRDGLLASLRAVVASDSGDYDQAAGHLMTLFTDREAPPTPASWRAPAPTTAPTTTPESQVTPAPGSPTP